MVQSQRFLNYEKTRCAQFRTKKMLCKLISRLYTLVI